MRPDHDRDRLFAGRYRLEREIGSGASATVYLARDEKHERAVAVKLLRPELGATLAGERFLREIAIAAQLQHPHILPLLDSGEAEGTLFFVTPFVEGDTVRERLRRQGTLSVSETVRILADVADALVYAHARGVVHRDIKPDNVILSGRHAVVMDFGVAKAVNAATTERQLTAGVALGTPAYMAPEQAMAEPGLDHRVDLYALGVLGYELLAGRPPFTGDGPQAVLTAHVVLTPEPIESHRPEIPGGLARVIMRCLAKRPAERWQSAAEIVDLLDPIVTPSGGSTPPAITPPTPARRWALRVAGLIGVVGLGLAIGDFAARRRAVTSLEASPTRLTFNGKVLEAAISPDGQFLAYVVEEEQGGERLLVQDLAGSAALPVGLAEQIVGLVWTRDGREISYWARRNGVASTEAVPRLGGPPRILARGPGYRSPDGSRVVLAGAPLTRLPVIRTGAGDTARLEQPQGFRWIVGLAWAPDADRLALAVTTPEELRSAIAISPLAGSPVIVARDSMALLAPVFGPDGRSLFYLRGRTGTVDLLRLELTPRDEPDGDPRVVATGLSVDLSSRRSPSFAPLSITADGRRIVYTRTERWSNIARVRLAGGRASSPGLLTMGTAVYSAPRLSPTGHKLAVFRSAARGVILGIADPDGTALQDVVTVEEGLDLAWAPDGKAIAFLAIRSDSGGAIGFHDLETGSTRYLAQGKVGSSLTWSARGVAVQAAGNRSLLIVDPRSGRIEPLVRARSDGFTFFPQISPDGRRLAYLESGGTTPSTLHTAQVGGTESEPLLRDGAYRPLRWTADGRAFYAMKMVPGAAPSLMLVPLQGNPRLLYTAPPGYAIEDIDLTGGVVLLNRMERQSDVWALDLAPADRNRR